MSWMVKRIQEDDFGCEERPDDARTQVLVTLADENGQERLIRVDDEWLYENGIDEGQFDLDVLRYIVEHSKKIDSILNYDVYYKE